MRTSFKSLIWQMVRMCFLVPLHLNSFSANVKTPVHSGSGSWGLNRNINVAVRCNDMRNRLHGICLFRQACDNQWNEYVALYQRETTTCAGVST